MILRSMLSSSVGMAFFLMSLWHKEWAGGSMLNGGGTGKEESAVNGGKWQCGFVASEKLSASDISLLPIEKDFLIFCKNIEA